MIKDVHVEDIDKYKVRINFINAKSSTGFCDFPSDMFDKKEGMIAVWVNDTTLCVYPLSNVESIEFKKFE